MRYNLFGVGNTGKSVRVTAQRRMNVYMDIQKAEDKSIYSYHGTPGLVLFADLGDTAIRGLHDVGNRLFAVHRNILWEFDVAGTATSRGTLNTTTGKVSMCHNSADRLMITDGTNGYFYDLSGNTLTTITDADYPDTARHCITHDDYFIVDSPDTGQFFISSAGATSASGSWDALDFATAEQNSDDLARAFSNGADLLLCGTETFEFWGNSGGADFPYELISGAVIELGLAARWSIAKFAESSVMCLANNSDQGDVTVVRIEGFRYTDVLDSDTAAVFNAYTTVSDAVGFSYTADGHPFYQLSFPTEGKTWLYDGKTQLWSEVSYGAAGARHRAEVGTGYNGKVYVGDYETGRIYRLDPSVYTDNGEPIVREIVSKHVFDERRIQIARAWLDIETGVGNVSGEGVDPQIMLQISRDGGHSYGNEKWASLGKLGEYTKRVIWRRLGMAYDWVFKVRMSEPVKFVLVGAWIDTA